MDSNNYTSSSDPRITISDFLLHIDKNEIIATILNGLTSKHKSISSKYFYNEVGAKLFEEITLLPEYYLTRTEKNILYEVSAHIAGELKDVEIIEIGSGDSSKISVLLKSVPGENMPTVCYIPVDVNRAVIENSAQALVSDFPGLKVHGVIADFERQLDRIPRESKRLFCFFGSTLGNFSREDSLKFLSDLGETMYPGDRFLLGVDMVKSGDILDKAYNDSKNITAQFNRNILNVVNRIMGTNFNQELFSHIAFYSEEHARIEMHLGAKEDMEISCQFLSHTITIKKGETIHTENSHKFTNEHIHDLASASELEIENIFTDDKQWFSLIKFVKEK